MIEPSARRHIGLLGATGAGIGAIVGGGILVLAGVAYARTGPAAIVAFALNGIVALITAASFAEMASAFPESGGAYTFAKKVLSVRAAFAVGWILWFAYIVAGVLYALGFASYAVLVAQNLWEAVTGDVPFWLLDRRIILFTAAAPAALFALSLIRKATGGGQWPTAGKLVVFAVIILAGVVALVRQPFQETQAALVPFMPGGLTGLLSAMGFTFIALQGFDLIAAIAGEVKDPGRTIPRAMFYSLGAALAVYLPLLFIVASVGVEPGESIGAVSRAQPETVMAVAVGRFMGGAGYWLVVLAAILSTLSALHANILAASRVALSMSRDRTLPSVIGIIHAKRGTPVSAIYATALALAAILFMVPNLAAAGAAASLIFLISFALAQVTAILARKRGGFREASFRTPWFPALPVAGTAACASLAVYQAVVSPQATGIVVIWLGLGGLLYFALFASRAETADASAEAYDPSLARLRGRAPLVLLPIANPAHAPAMVAVANALAPRDAGRVVLLTILPRPGEVEPKEIQRRLDNAQLVIREALAWSFGEARAPEALVTSASFPYREIGRVATVHRCESLLLGFGPLAQAPGDRHLETLVNEVDCHVALMRAPDGWRLSDAKRILVPVGGWIGQGELRARLLGSLCRTANREVTYLRVERPEATQAEMTLAEREIEIMAKDEVPVTPAAKVIRADDRAAAILAESAHHDLLVLGLTRRPGHRTEVDGVARTVALQASCATILLSRRR